MGKWLSILASALWLLGTAGQAQQSPPPGEPVPTRGLNLTMQDRHVIKELIKDLKLAPAATSAKAVGDVVAPDAVHDIPADVGRKVPEVKAHRFVYTAERILIIDSRDNRVVEVIEQ
jgi:hypothetical protein